MAAKKRCAVVFIHGLAKKPSPAKLEEIWLWGLGRADPNGEVFPNPNPGLDLDVEGIPGLFNYCADVFYGEDYETEFGSYYELSANEANNTEVPAENVSKVTGDIVPARPETPREQRFLEVFEQKMRAQQTPADLVPPARPRPKAVEPGQLEIA